MGLEVTDIKGRETVVSVQKFSVHEKTHQKVDR